MPARYSIDSSQHVVFTTLSEVVTLDDVVALIARLRDDPQFDSSYSELVDLSGTDEVRLGFTDFHHLATIDPFTKKAKRAFVVPQHGAVFGVTRMFQQIRRENPDIRIFSSREEALEWVGLK